MRALLIVAFSLVCIASGSFRGDFAPIFNTWKPSENVRLEDDFDHLTQIFHPQAHEEEHARRKRNAIETARFAVGSPITKACNRPGYTGQYCEFPICDTLNPLTNPQQFLGDEGYVVDLTELGNCTRQHKIIVDDTMYDIRIEVQSLDNIYPLFEITDENGNIAYPDQMHLDADRYVETFKYLAPGAYFAQPSATSQESRCILTTTAQTTLTISGGFQTDERDRSDFPNENAGAHQFNSIMLTLYGGRAPAALKTVSVIGPDNYVLRPRSLDKRYGCQYEFYFDSLFCYNRGSYAMIVEGVDFFGNLFRRVAPFECVYQPGPTTASIAPTTPQPTNPSSCANGGVLLANGGKTTCICQDHWTGYDCSQAVCVNGGTRIEGKCFCPIGFEGVHCEQVKCEPNSNHGFGIDRPTLVFVIRTRAANNPIVEQVQQAIDEVITNLQFDATYLARFHLVLFNDHEIYFSRHYDSIKWFNSDLITASNNRDLDGGCYENVLEALAIALTDASLTQGSTVYVITDALADDYSKQIEGILQMNSFWRATINFVYVEPPPELQCVSDASDPGFRAYDEVANRFGGLAWHVQDRNKVHDVLYGHMNSILYKSQLMLTLDREECSKGLGKVIQLEKDTETLVFISRGRDFELNLISPDGQNVKMKTIVREGIFTVRQWSYPLPGTYLVKASSSTPNAACSLRAYQASVQSLSSPQTEVYWAMSTDVDTDAIMYQPLAGIGNNPVFHVEDFGDDVDHAFAFLNMYAVRDGVEKEVYASNGLYRGGCTFQFYFPSFRCRANENLHYEFNLRNDLGFYIQRAGVMTCFNYIPTPAAPTDCQNGGVKYNETCLCQSHYEGEHCDTLVCENGGAPIFGACQCPAGWTGPYCTYPQCSEQGPLPSNGYHVDMAFLVEVTAKGVDQIAQLLNMLPEIIRDVSSQHAEWIDRLVLIGYDKKGVIGMVDTPISDTQPFFDTLSQWYHSDPAADDECYVQTWQAIDMLLNGRKDGEAKRSLPERSIVNIIEASIANEDDTSLIAAASEELLERRVITNVFQGNDWDPLDHLKCLPNSDFNSLEKIARRGDGMFYILGATDLGRAVRMIPTLFSSSIVYKFHSDDCATTNKFVYFPLDAYTQTVSAVVFGVYAIVDLRRSDGSSFKADGRVEILNDGYNTVIEFRNACDNDWQPASQYCMYINKFATKNFKDTSDLCASSGGFIADDLSGDKTYWLSSALGELKGWLGLTFVKGHWVFQHGNGSQMPVPRDRAQWAGVTIPDGSTGTCAYFHNSLWYPSECYEEYAVICQKHMFDQDNQPSNLEDDDLSPGKYYLVIETNVAGITQACDVEVRVQSSLNVEFGFVDGLRKDAPHPIANIDSNDNRLVSSVSLGKAKTQNTKLQYVQLRSDEASSTLFEAATYSYRLGCSYEFVSQPLNCDLTKGEDFSVMMIGEDDTGNTFQRYSTSRCSKWYVCQNGGVYSNGQCLCADYFTGDECETPQCQNGGELSGDGGSCVCPTGYGGDACQFVPCDVNSAASFSNSGKALVLVIEKSANIAAAIEKIGYTVQNIVETMNQRHNGWIDKYIVQTFDLDGNVDELVYFVDEFPFASFLLDLGDDAANFPGACQMPIWKALDHLIDSQYAQYLPGSEVLIIATAAPVDADLAAIYATMEKFDIHTPIVDLLHIETTQCPWDEHSKDQRDFANFLSTTGGIIFRSTIYLAGMAVDGFVPTRYAPQRLSYSDPFNCKNNDIYVQVDTGMAFVYVMVGGPWTKDLISVEGPKQDKIDPFLSWNADEQCMYTFQPKYPGVYKITVNSENPTCFPMVYGSGGVVGTQHAAQVFFGFIQDYKTLDTPKPYAVYGAVNFPVFKIYEQEEDNVPVEMLYTARISRRSSEGKDEESYTSDIDQRIGCSYTYVGKAFTCVEENDVITLSASGVDYINQPFTRQTTTYCKTDGTRKHVNASNRTRVRY